MVDNVKADLEPSRMSHNSSSKDPRGLMVAGDIISQHLQTISIQMRQIAKQLGDSLGVNLTDLAAMEQLITSGPLTSTDLAARLKVTTAASTHIIHRLERAGHIARERQSDDKRKVLIVADPASVERAFQHLAPMLNGLDGIVANLAASDRAVIEQFLRRVIELLASSGPQGSSES